jgi:hypothetical protein
MQCSMSETQANSVIYVHLFLPCQCPSICTLYPNQTHQNSSITAAKKPNHAFHPTPVFSAILSMRFMVPLSLFREFSN